MARMEDLPELWRQWRENGCQIARTAIIEHYSYVVKVTASKQTRGLPPSIEREDLIGAGMVGLIRAVEDFDPDRGVKFLTYAITLIRGSILEMLRNDDWIPRSVREEERRVKDAHRRLRQQLGRQASETELADELGISVNHLDEILGRLGRMHLLSLEDLCVSKAFGSETLSLAEILPLDESGVVEHVAIRERSRAIAAAICRLPERERTVIRLYFGKERTHKEIGAKLGISESRAYQLQKQALARLSMYLRDRLEDVL